jgi:hypothetical protein
MNAPQSMCVDVCIVWCNPAVPFAACACAADSHLMAQVATYAVRHRGFAGEANLERSDAAQAVDVACFFMQVAGTISNAAAAEQIAESVSVSALTMQVRLELHACLIHVVCLSYAGLCLSYACLMLSHDRMCHERKTRSCRMLLFLCMPHFASLSHTLMITRLRHICVHPDN